ncbi:glutathione S-transferase theta-1 [Aricia agestis]|uniref:glutathione S-transferase theta-1 n=1 Tax=Aricia agestis TaxID=91739 RepID=UPI001C20B5A9|nr:glutathione S-transferase theta-1 [Aricia agestis]
MSVKLYYDLMSQPSRALYILLKYSKCNFEPRYLDLRTGEHFSEEFSAINRFQKLPVITHNDFILTESIAIVRYLANQNLITESVYPRDLKQQARVDEFLEWHHIGLRLYFALYFRYKYLNPILSGKPADPKTVAKHERYMENSLEVFATKWLGNGTEFVAGDTVTVADLFAACELEQPRMAGFDPFDKYDVVRAWYDKVRAHFSPYYEEGHVVLNKVVKKQASKL